MEHPLDHTVALLTRTPAALNALLRGLPDIWTHKNEGEGSWTVYEVIGHLIHADRTDWLDRTRMILQFGETRVFEPFDRFGKNRDTRSKTLEELLDEFASVRTKNLAELRDLNLQPSDLLLRGRHPVFGAVTLSQLLATWVAHDLTHLHQITRVMAYQYREAVGPWTVYLGVMQCAGHSSAS